MVNGALSSQPLLCPSCRNQVGVAYSDGTVVTKRSRRIVRIERGEITCERCQRGIPIPLDNCASTVVR